jgi:hypothetical protein
VQNRNLFTHAWLPRDRFDAVSERGGWLFARKGDGYLALRSQQPVRWVDASEGQASGRNNVWICELGRRATDESFERFIARIAAAELRFGNASVCFQSPSQGRIEFGWRGPLRRDGATVSQRGFGRYESPWVATPFPSEEVHVECARHRLRLQWRDATRFAN